MNYTTTILSASLLLLASKCTAQDAVPPVDHPMQRAAAYAEALGLEERWTMRLMDIYSQAEASLAAAREQYVTAKAKYDQMMAPVDARAEALLTPEQRAQLELMKANGTWHPDDPGCSHFQVKEYCKHARPIGFGCCPSRVEMTKEEVKPQAVDPMITE